MEDRLLVFEITEELDHHNVEIIRRRADYEIQRFMPKRVVFDFNRVVFMDSAGIGFVIRKIQNSQQSWRKIGNDKGKRKLKKSFRNVRNFENDSDC